MALATLPYPSMDFVPLDILTAEEMNQLVANIEAINNATVGTNQIADNAITTAKLNDSAVTSSKIDWTTLASGDFSKITKHATGTQAYGTKYRCERFGNLVVTMVVGFPTSSMPASGTGSETIPVGYRPIRESVGILRTSYGGNGTAGIGRINTDGIFGWWSPIAIGTNEVTFMTVYLTNDSMPS